MLTAAGPALPRVRADLTRLPLPAASCDGVLALYALQNVADWGAAVDECVRVLRPGGLALVAWGGAPSPDPLVQLITATYLDRVRPWAGTAAQHHGLTSTEVGTARFEQAGCRADVPVTVVGVQWRSARQLVDRLAGNPFRARPPEMVTRTARAEALAAVEHEFGQLDEIHRIEVPLVLHPYRRHEPPPA